MNYLNENLEAYAEVAQPGMAAAWYAARDAMNPTQWLFGPSKFIGYQGIRTKAYGSGEFALNGGEAEQHLQRTDWFEAVDDDHPLSEELIEQLESFRSELGTQPRNGCRINVLKDGLEYEANTSGHIFISYSKQSPGPTRKLAARLEENGFKVWWDTDLISGDDYEAVIRSKIESASAVIVIWSRASVSSLFVKSEAKRALRANKLICAMTDGIDEADVPMPFDQLPAVAADDFEEILWALEQHGVIRD